MSGTGKFPAPGFELVSEGDLEEFRSRGIFLRHIKTGCEIYHVLNADTDNLFSFTFKTLPRDDSGVAHILEHSVLCGSRGFPVKDPFLLLLKGSAHTFMNAFTFPDKTIYPASSQVEEDFYNLFKVYGDAVFFPLLRREAFWQEGQRREIEGGRLSAVGIVYNEMKGNYSTHDSIAGEWAYRALFPGTPYAFDSGGEPLAILDLGYEDFKAFHAAYYHPSNCRIFLYGNIPTERHLAFLEENFLSRFGRAQIQTDFAPPRSWDAPRFLERLYPAGEGETEEASSSVTLNWLLSPVTDPLKVLSLEILSEILLGNPGSPLRKALIDSRLGEDLSPVTGIETEMREMVFSVGLRGTSPGKAEKIEELVFSVLKDLCAAGLDAEQVEGALRRVEFYNREIREGAAFGMRLMRRALCGWLHGGHPERTMKFRARMDDLKAILGREKRYFESLIETQLLGNPHRTTLVVKPDPGLAARREAETRKKLDAEAAALGQEGFRRLEEELAGFKAFQETPDSPEALKTIPSLRLEVIPRKLENIPTRKVDIPGIRESYAHDLYTNGIVYADFAFDLGDAGSGCSGDMFAPLFASALPGLGAGGKSYDRIARELALKTGGFQTLLEAGASAGEPERVRRFLFLRIEALEAAFPEALDLVRTILLEPDFEDEKRLRDIFLECCNAFKSTVIPSGNAYAASRAERRLSLAERVEESWKGISQYQFAAALSAQKAPAEMRENFMAIKRKYINRGRLIANYTCEEKSWAMVEKALEGFAAALPGGGAVEAPAGVPVPPQGAPPAGDGSQANRANIEAIAVPSDVCFVASAVRAARFGSPEHAHEAVLAHLLSTGFLWEKIRMRGGAYGASCAALGLDRVFSFSSYRDPNIVSTLEAFREAVRDIAEKGVDAESAKNAVIGTAAREMKPLSPSSKGIVGFRRRLYEMPDELRQQRQRLVLDTRPEDIAAAAARISAAFGQSYSAVIGGREAISAAAQTLPDLKKNYLELSL
ncbi:MAG: insulinase family protein [Spirochaetia bacterium]|jgi:Zn-dependent M16 (insulinase) family peptidase|nr:insulinase family protein [Spirochaetia bacterium]